ncbi:HEPC1 protein, partial [Picathartes gymnocephalus]|nr:HEPC1 protein [Picathartes gymnocephalus]
QVYLRDPRCILGVPGVFRPSSLPSPQAQVALESPLEPKPLSPMGDGQLTWTRRRRHSPHFPLCSFCCNCCHNRGCGFCCRT